MDVCSKLLLIGFLSAGSAVALAQAPPMQASASHGRLVQQTTVVRGTAAYENVRQFLLEHAGASQHASFDHQNALPAKIAVTTTRQVSAGPAYSPMLVPAPPASPPMGNYVAGDTYTLSVQSGTTTESWTFVYTGKSWSLTDYSYHTKYMQK